MMKKILLLMAIVGAATSLQAKHQWTMNGRFYDVDTLVYPHKVGPGVT